MKTRIKAPGTLIIYPKLDMLIDLILAPRSGVKVFVLTYNRDDQLKVTSISNLINNELDTVTIHKIS